MDPTTRRRLGSSSVHVTALGLGTVPLGGLYSPVEEADGLALVRRAYDLGVRLFDTAPQYGVGLSERRLGMVLPEFPRDSIVVATKVGRLLRPVSLLGKTRQVVSEAAANRDLRRIGLGARHLVHRLRSSDVHGATAAGGGDRPATPRLEAIFDFSPDGVRRSLEESLARLRLDRVDVVYFHDPDYYHDQALAAFKVLEELRSAGTIGAIGVGMNQSAMLARFAREADFDCFLVAGRYTLLDQIALHDLLPVCQERGSSIVIGGVYNSGILADARPGAYFDYHPAPPAVLQRAQRIQAVCSRYDVPLAAAAIQFPFGHPSVASVLTGSRSVAEIEQNAALFSHPIPDELWDDLRAEGLLPDQVPTPRAGHPAAERVAAHA
ncbi:MAG TPA: aldo/keto reductase [Candidatus Limnocylindrales bacterium]